MNIYCVYVTCYGGNLLPPFYIGSSSIKKIEDGYRGSVSSKLYHDIWKQEIQDNPHLFKTFIISRHTTRKEAIEKELFFHQKLSVVKCPLYINLSIARKDGFFGRDVSGKNNPMFGKDRSANHPRGMLGKKHTEETKQHFSNIRKGKQTGKNNPMYGKTWTPEMREKILAKRIGVKRGPYKKKNS